MRDRDFERWGWEMQMSHKSRLALLLVCLFAASTAWASISGSISGIVTDPNGSVVPGANVTAIDAAIQTVANDRGTIGASVVRLQDASAVMTTQVTNLTAAENNIMAADIPSTISNLSRQSVLSQTGMAALAQANSQEQSILKLLQ